MIVDCAQAQIAVERRVASDLGLHGEAADLAGAACQAQIEAAQRLAIMTDHHAELDVEIESACGLCLPWSGASPASEDFTKLRPS